MLHRDLKPDNMMFTETGQLKIIDFGMAKQYKPETQLSQRTFTLVYRPPEIILGAKYYGPASDMWTVGCILAEIVLRDPLFPGCEQLDQLQRIYAIRGTPDVSVHNNLIVF